MRGRSRSRSPAVVRPRRRSPVPPPRSFRYRAGVRLVGTTVACDPQRTANEVVFLSHAPPVEAGRARAGAGAGGRGALIQQVLLTGGTLASLGARARRYGGRTLVCDIGHPFSLGELRLELFPSGFAPGAASLLCGHAGRRIVYAGPLWTGPTGLPLPRAEIRHADALCLDASFGAPADRAPPRAEAVAAAVQFAERALAGQRRPVLLVDPGAAAIELGLALAVRGHRLRGHPTLRACAADFSAQRCGDLTLLPFSGTLGPGEILLVPPGARRLARVARLSDPAFALLTGPARDPALVARAGAELGIVLGDRADHAALLAYAEAVGAAEVATTGAHAEALAVALRARGHEAYALGPPRQIGLFSR